MTTKRVLQRPFGRRKNGGWVIENRALITSLKDSDAVEFGKIIVGTAELIKLLRLLPTLDTKISANGRLELETVERFHVGEGENRTARFRKPKKHCQFLGIQNKAWLPGEVKRLVVLKPRKY